MPEVPLLRPSQVIKAFERFGWEVARRRSSHIIMTKKGHTATLSVPDHSHVARGTLRSLLHKSGVQIEDFIRTLD